MKKMIQQIGAAVAVVLLTMSTMSFTISTDDSSPKKGKPGTELVKKELSTPAFETIKISGNFKVVLIEGTEQKVVVEAPEQLTGSVQSFLDNTELNVYTTDTVKKRITLYVTLKDIRNISTYGDVKIVKN
ncbi:hypothetical protein C3K47_06260 [Solitalea longa]|uniref:Putative auto-transporter adhesin head GIN domain-containing protein n=1 Tax=Solitalea longa TaxID=2079460 RepID=A0A2S5A4X5_9SPHI|nr:DUF2807 domain-containing protein [Solitalea longa]POY37362.1 hypothetical protein C3K47_06260 [Solitalea longa]